MQHFYEYSALSNLLITFWLMYNAPTKAFYNHLLTNSATITS